MKYLIIWPWPPTGGWGRDGELSTVARSSCSAMVQLYFLDHFVLGWCVQCNLSGSDIGHFQIGVVQKHVYLLYPLSPCLPTGSISKRSCYFVLSSETIKMKKYLKQPHGNVGFSTGCPHACESPSACGSMPGGRSEISRRRGSITNTWRQHRRLSLIKWNA